MKKAVIWIVLGVIACITANIAMAFYNTMKEAETIQIKSIDISQIADGMYEGEYQIGLVQVVAEVMVQDGKLSRIQLLEHHNGLGKKAEDITRIMIEENRLDVDTITHATISSLAIAKACEQAITEY